MRAIARDKLVTVLSIPLDVDEYGSFVYNTSDADEIASGYGTLQPFMTVEDDVNRDTVSLQARLISDDPSLFNVKAENMLSIDGIVYRVDGKPFLWTLRGNPHHIEISILLLEG